MHPTDGTADPLKPERSTRHPEKPSPDPKNPNRRKFLAHKAVACGVIVFAAACSHSRILDSDADPDPDPQAFAGSDVVDPNALYVLRRPQAVLAAASPFVVTALDPSQSPTA